MWFGILFAVLVEIVPLAVRSTTVGVFLFVMNNIGGNLPILMEPVRKATSFQDSLAIFYAGAYLISELSIYKLCLDRLVIIWPYTRSQCISSFCIS